MTNFEGTKERLFIETLIQAGHTDSYFVGGCVRDYLLSQMNEKPISLKDIDITTSASPLEVKEALKPVANYFDFVGNNYGVLIVDGIEIAQFRSEEYVNNGDGKPVTSPTTSLYEDAKRRDFTVNAMYMDLEGTIIDPFNGKEDLLNGVIRAIDEPLKRFEEDSSRILRMFYLAARFNFSIDPKTLKIAGENKELIHSVPEELKGKILGKVIDSNCLSTYLSLIKECDMLVELFPELSHTVGMPQNPKYHKYDVFEHIVKVISVAESHHPADKTMALAALFHDNQKGVEGIRGINNDGLPNDLGHEEAGVSPAKKAMIRLQFGKHAAKDVSFLIKHHGLRLPPNPKKRSVVKALRKMALDAHNKGELISRTNMLFDFMYLDAEGFSDDFAIECKELLDTLKPKFLEVLDNHLFYISELPISGKDLISLGFPQGKIIQETLEELLMLNTQDRETALDLSSRRLKKEKTLSL